MLSEEFDDPCDVIILSQLSILEGELQYILDFTEKQSAY